MHHMLITPTLSSFYFLLFSLSLSLCLQMIHLKNKLCREKITALRDEISKLREELENNKTLQREKKSVQEGVTKGIG